MKKLLKKKNDKGEISVMFNTCRRYIQTVPTSSGATTTLQLYVPERSKSCLGFVAMSRPTAALTDISSYTNTFSLFPTPSATTSVLYSYA